MILDLSPRPPSDLTLLPNPVGLRAGKNETQHSGGWIQEELAVCPPSHSGGLHWHPAVSERAGATCELSVWATRASWVEGNRAEAGCVDT